MRIQVDDSQERSSKRLFLPSLVIANFAVSLSIPIVTLLTVDIASTFQVPTGIAAQLSTANRLAEVVFVLIISFLAVRFKHKSLLLVGMSLVVLASIGSFFASSISALQFFFFVEGSGTSLVSIMSYTILGDTLPLRRKAKAVSYIAAVSSLVSIIGTPIIGFVANIGGWRSIFPLLVLPVSVSALVLAFRGLQVKSKEKSAGKDFGSYFQAFKRVLHNSSATACLVGGMLRSASALVPIFAVAFYRERFLIPRDLAVGIILVAAATYVIVSLITGRVVDRFGAKNLAVIGTIGTGVLVPFLFSMPNLWLAVTIDIVQICFSASSLVAFNCLALDQVPSTRSTMMSLKSLFASIGTSVVSAIGGVVLIFYNYTFVGILLGSFCFASAAVFYFFVKNPVYSKLPS